MPVKRDWSLFRLGRHLQSVLLKCHLADCRHYPGAQSLFTKCMTKFQSCRPMMNSPSQRSTPFAEIQNSVTPVSLTNQQPSNPRLRQVDWLELEGL